MVSSCTQGKAERGSFYVKNDTAPVLGAGLTTGGLGGVGCQHFDNVAHGMLMMMMMMMSRGTVVGVARLSPTIA